MFLIYKIYKIPLINTNNNKLMNTNNNKLNDNNMNILYFFYNSYL